MPLTNFFYEFSDDGRCITTDVVLRMYTVTRNGAVDPTTGREYGILCNNVVDGKPCHSKLFTESEDMMFVTCKACGAVLGYRQADEGEMQ